MDISFIERNFKKLQRFVADNFLLVGFCGAIIIAFLYPYAGKIIV